MSRIGNRTATRRPSERRSSMAFWRGIGGYSTIASGAAVTWEIVYPGGGDVGTIVASPNIVQPQIDVELIASDPGVVARQTPGEGGPATHYSVKIRNAG